MLSGDHVYKMDYAKMLRAHRERGAAATIACLEVPVDEGSRFGVVQIDTTDRVTGFQEKPRHPTPIPGSDGMALVSMGIYVFEADALYRALEADAARQTSHDFGKDILPAHDPGRRRSSPTASTTRTRRRRSTGATSARSTPTTRPTWISCQVNPEFNLYDPEWPMRTWQSQAPPAKFVFADEGQRCGQALDSIISSGCIVSGSRVDGSMLCPNVRVHSFCRIEQSILMPGVRVGRHSRIRRAIIDRDVFIPRGACIGFNAEEDRKRHTVTDKGIVVVTTEDEPLVEEPDHDVLDVEAEWDSRGVN